MCKVYGKDMNDKIDIVLTWVDGNDPAWRESFEYYASKETDAVQTDASRFREWDTLRYWFRGIEKFAPWANRVFFVTCGHYPEWLDKDHPKLTLVKHADFIPSEYLPTFNSNVIEFWFHRIAGLSERFVYFNDDTFLLGPVTPDRFFRNGLPCDFGGMTVNIHDGVFGTSVMLARTLINEHFNKKEVVLEHPSKWFNARYPLHSFLNLLLLTFRKAKFPGFVNPHLPQGYLKSVYDAVWASCTEDLIRTSRSRFRKYGDIAIWLTRYWQLASNLFSPYNVYRDGKYYLMEDGNIGEIVRCISRQEKKVVCLNDNAALSDFETSKRSILKAFDLILPERSGFEKL